MNFNFIVYISSYNKEKLDLLDNINIFSKRMVWAEDLDTTIEFVDKEIPEIRKYIQIKFYEVYLKDNNFANSNTIIYYLVTQTTDFFRNNGKVQV